MHQRRPARSHLFVLIGILLLAMLLSGCQKTTATLVSPAQAATTAPSPLLPSETALPPGPTATRILIPATWTPRAPLDTATPTVAPSLTATPHYADTMTAATAAWKATICQKYDGVWQVRLARSWRAGWCDLNSALYSYYEYSLSFPSAWKVNTFGDVYPNLIFATGLPKTELRLYQIFSYDTKKYTGTLEEVPEKATFCDRSEKCFLVVDPNETIVQREVLTMGAKNVLVLDSQDGRYYVRRYFFKMLFTAYKPQADRLFMIKLYTPTQIGAVSAAQVTSEEDEAYRDLLTQIEHMLGTFQQDTNRR